MKGEGKIKRKGRGNEDKKVIEGVNAMKVHCMHECMHGNVIMKPHTMYYFMYVKKI
jgi:CobQ-like glutamine amidotransferase family enzyme